MPALSVLIAVLFLVCSSYLLRRQTTSNRTRSDAGHPEFRVGGAEGAVRDQPSLVDDWFAPILVCAVTLGLLVSVVWFWLSPAE